MQFINYVNLMMAGGINSPILLSGKQIKGLSDSGDADFQPTSMTFF